MNAAPPAVPPRLTGLPPVIGPQTRCLVLGSFPSEASLRAGQYYAHPRNQFWPLLSALWGLSGSEALQHRPYGERLEQVLAHGWGIWDVYGSCQRQGSLDSAIEEAQLNPLERLRTWAPALQVIAHNGGESARHMRITRRLGLPVVRLPSTSPANASWRFERKVEAWRDTLQPWLQTDGQRPALEAGAG